MFCSLRHISRGQTGFRYASTAKNVSASSALSAGTKPALLDTTYHKLIADQVNLYPHKDCFRITSEDSKYTFKEVLTHQDAVASGLLESAGKAGSSTALTLPLKSESFFTQLGAARADRLWAPLQPLSPAAVLVSQLKEINVGSLVWPAKVHKTVQLDEIYEAFPALNNHQRDIPFRDARFPSLRQILHTAKTALPGMIAYQDHLVYNNRHPLHLLEKTIDSKKPTTILLSPENKKVILSQHTIINIGYLVGKQINLSEEDIICTTLQLNTISGLSLGVGLSLSHKAKLVYSSELFDASELQKTLTEEFCTTVVAKPSELQELLASGASFPSLNKVIVSATPDDFPSSGLISSLQGKKLDVVVVFATSTEVISVSDVNQFKDRSLGSPLAHTQIKVVDGSIVVSGFHVDGDVNTGVKARIDDKGQLILA